MQRGCGHHSKGTSQHDWLASWEGWQTLPKLLFRGAPQNLPSPDCCSCMYEIRLLVEVRMQGRWLGGAHSSWGLSYSELCTSTVWRCETCHVCSWSNGPWNQINVEVETNRRSVAKIYVWFLGWSKIHCMNDSEWAKNLINVEVEIKRKSIAKICLWILEWFKICCVNDSKWASKWESISQLNH